MSAAERPETTTAPTPAAADVLSRSRRERSLKVQILSIGLRHDRPGSGRPRRRRRISRSARPAPAPAPSRRTPRPRVGLALLTALLESTGLSESTVSHHFGRLRKAGLVAAETLSRRCAACSTRTAAADLRPSSVPGSWYTGCSVLVVSNPRRAGTAPPWPHLVQAIPGQCEEDGR
ncbi:winged helix-turn-helix domain-containing protein [Nocardia sp. NPDC057663]|uniref:helix-turn-helix domain-containing protein n=1 Tax=Nocardia sp. NPDC057663 TaxID=3346201 RepID=UPI0036725359